MNSHAPQADCPGWSQAGVHVLISLESEATTHFAVVFLSVLNSFILCTPVSSQRYHQAFTAHEWDLVDDH